jgi:hypothetical protein
MPTSAASAGIGPKPAQQILSTPDTLLLAAWFGLVAGILELCGLILTKHVFHTTEFYKQGKFFWWGVPLSNLAILLVPGIVAAGFNGFRLGPVPLRVATWMLATLALWAFLLNMPIAGWAGLLLAAGLGRTIGRRVLALVSRSRRWMYRSLAALAGLLVTIAAVSIGGQAIAGYLATARLPAPPKSAPNVLLLVMDTVRAESLSLQGYKRDTTPQLTGWAERGVKFDWAMAPACWTFPSHCSFFTGYWPYKPGL